jgi:hypothetical protein
MSYVLDRLSTQAGSLVACRSEYLAQLSTGLKQSRFHQPSILQSSKKLIASAIRTIDMLQFLLRAIARQLNLLIGVSFLECPAIQNLFRSLEAYVVVTAAVIMFSSFKFGEILVQYFWIVAGALVLGALGVVLFNRHTVKSQTVARQYVIKQVAQELCETLEEQGGKSDLRSLKSSLHPSCRPYFDLAIALLNTNNKIEWT